MDLKKSTLIILIILIATFSVFSQTPESKRHIARINQILKENDKMLNYYTPKDEKRAIKNGKPRYYFELKNNRLYKHSLSFGGEYYSTYAYLKDINPKVSLVNQVDGKARCPRIYSIWYTAEDDRKNTSGRETNLFGFACMKHKNGKYDPVIREFVALMEKVIQIEQSVLDKENQKTFDSISKSINSQGRKYRDNAFNFLESLLEENDKTGKWDLMYISLVQKEIEKAIEYGIDDREALLLYGWISYIGNEPERAIRNYHYSLTKFPDDPEIYFQMGNCFELSNKIDRAIYYWKKSGNDRALAKIEKYGN